MSEPTPQEPGEHQLGPTRESSKPGFGDSWAGRAFRHFIGTSEGKYQLAFGVLLVAALVIRLWELSGRTMHYDEAIHLYYSWRLSNLEGFVHSPWMHGPFQIELVALFLRLFGDTDVAARLAYVIFGTVLVGLPYVLRDSLGRAGALITGFMLAVSPSLLYFSRFGRNDIIMVVLAVSLFALLWHYSNKPRNLHLYLASALLAVAFASKETAYIISVIFGMLALLMAVPFAAVREQLTRRPSSSKSVIPGPMDCTSQGGGILDPPHTNRSTMSWPERLKNALDLRRLNAPAGFLVLLVTLTLPQWSAGVELGRDVVVSLYGQVFGTEAASALTNSFGLTLAATEGVSQGIVGAPAWEAPFVQLPLDFLPAWLPGIALFLVVAVGIFAGWWQAQSFRHRIAAVLIPVLVAYSFALWLVKPMGGLVDTTLAVIAAAACLAAFVCFRLPWRSSFAFLFLPAIAATTYCLLFLPVLKVDALLIDILPEGIQLASSGNAVPLNFLVAGGILLAMGTASLVVGLLWKGGTWLICAVIFYAIWITLFTTFFTNPAGVFSGAWQGMGYWIAQQDVARGNQPWYYYFIGMSVYEFLPFIFGIIGAAVFVMRDDRFGMALAFWASVNLLAYTVASEKMPWLLVNITVPFIFLAGKLLGELADRISWRRAFSRGRGVSSVSLLALIGIALGGSALGILSLTVDGPEDIFLGIIALAASALAAFAGAWLIRRSAPIGGPALAAVGIAAILAGFTIWTSFQAAYSFDDSRREILVYAQGSADLRNTIDQLDEGPMSRGDSNSLSTPVQVDYDVWYPFQWYVRHHVDEGKLTFSCFKDGGGEGGCDAIESNSDATAMLVAAHNRGSSPGGFQGFNQSGPSRNLLWFPETYRRPGENRQSENFLEEVEQDLQYFREAAGSREKWNQALNYIFFRDMESDWFNSEYYTYLRREQTDVDGAN